MTRDDMEPTTASDAEPASGDSADAHLPQGPMRTLRVQLPLGFHLRLHELKLLTGAPFSQIVGQALERYLEDVPRAVLARGRTADPPAVVARVAERKEPPAAEPR